MLDQEDAVDDELLDIICRARDSGLSPAKLAAILQLERQAVDKTVTERQRVLQGSRLIRPHHRCLADHIENSAYAAHSRSAPISSINGEAAGKSARTRTRCATCCHTSRTRRFRAGGVGRFQQFGVAAAKLRETLTVTPPTSRSP